MSKRATLLFGALGGAVLLGAGTMAATQVQAADNFFAGKTVRMIIGFGPGGGYDRWARAIARHIGDHLPGKPNVVPQNMPGAGSYVAASYIYNVAPKDGTVIGEIARDAAIGPLTGEPGAKFDPLKISWLGSPTTETNICISYKTAKVKTVGELFKHQLIVGDTGPGTGTRTYPKVLNAILGTKFKLVGGYHSSVNVFLAMERGEVQGICESYSSVHRRRPDWIKNHTINILFQGSTEPDPDLKGIPFILDYAKTKSQKQALRFTYAGQGIGRPFVAPPGLAPERLKELRDAFNETMKDPAFLADAKRSKLDVRPKTGQQLLAIMKELYETPKPLIQKIAAMVKK